MLTGISGSLTVGRMYLVSFSAPDAVSVMLEFGSSGYFFSASSLNFSASACVPTPFQPLPSECVITNGVC